MRMQAAPRIVVVGAGGRLGAALVREYSRESEVLGFNHQQLDLAQADNARVALSALDFDALINCAAQTNVDRCETHPDEAFQLNAEAARVLAEVCAAKGAKLVHISTDYIFDGAKREPYTEEDDAHPISVYGESKLAGEHRVLEVSDQHLVVRVSWVFGPDRPSFIDWAVQQARQHDHVEAIGDKLSAPSYTVDLAEMLRRLIDRDATGIVHATNAGSCSWQEYGQHAIDCCIAEGVSMKARTIDPVPLASMTKFIARRPLYTTLATAKYSKLTGHTPRHWHDAVADYVRTHVASQ